MLEDNLLRALAETKDKFEVQHKKFSISKIFQNIRKSSLKIHDSFDIVIGRGLNPQTRYNFKETFLCGGNIDIIYYIGYIA